MRIFSFAALVLLLAMPLAASASFSGNWVGSGGADYAPGNSAACTQVNFQFNQGFTTFEIVSARAICGGAVYNFPTGVLTVENGILKDRGLAVGMIGPDFFHLSYSFRPGQLNILDIRMSGKGALSLVHTAAQVNSGTDAIRATLNLEKK